jgi:hypothetical protein
LFLVSLLCYPLGGEIRAFGQKCGLASFIGFWVALPVLLAQAYFAALRRAWWKLPRARRTLKAALFLCLLALVISFAGNLMVRIVFYSYGHPTYFREGNHISGLRGKWDNVEGLYPELAAKIPRGETEWRALPEEIRSELGLEIMGLVDVWGSPRMLVAEDREGGLWLGFYSRGADRFSSNRGNDADDISSWSGGWKEVYARQVNRPALIGDILSLFFGFVVALPIFLWLYDCFVKSKGHEQT